MQNYYIGEKSKKALPYGGNKGYISHVPAVWYCFCKMLIIMKKTMRNAAGIIAGIFLSFNAFTQSIEVNKISTGLSTGNSSLISELFLSNLDLNVAGNDDVYSKAQATQILRNFFEQNSAMKFTVEHEGSSKNGDIYRIGTLTTKSGNYRVTFFLKNDGGKFMVKELRIEKAGGF